MKGDRTARTDLERPGVGKRPDGIVGRLRTSGKGSERPTDGKGSTAQRRPGIREGPAGPRRPRRPSGMAGNAPGRPGNNLSGIAQLNGAGRPGRGRKGVNAGALNVRALGKRKTPDGPGFVTGILCRPVLFTVQFEQTTGKDEKPFQAHQVRRRKGFQDSTQRPTLIRQRQSLDPIPTNLGQSECMVRRDIPLKTRTGQTPLRRKRHATRKRS